MAKKNQNAGKEVGNRDSSAIFSERVGDVYIRMMLDIRNRAKNYTEHTPIPLCIRFVLDGKRAYYRLGEQYTEDELVAIRLSTGHGEKIVEGKETRFQTKMRLNSMFMQYVQMVQNLDNTGALTLERIMTALTGKSHESSLVEFWQHIIDYKMEHGQAGTGKNYQHALNSFKEHLKYTPKNGFSIDHTVVRKWETALRNKGIADATIGIYFRALRYVINECIAEGFMQPKDRMFGKDVKRSEKIAIPVGKSRREWHISVAQMTDLYHYWKNRSLNMPRLIQGQKNPFYAIRSDVEENNLYKSLAMFLVQYLGCGANLYDLALMRYDEFYYANKGEALHFFRHKTQNTAHSGEGTEVIIPIIEPLHEIMDAYAAEPERDALVFPFLLGEDINGSDADKAKRIKQENHNIRDRLKKITAHLKWEENLTNTWARHSFATNMNFAEVPMHYISFAMGHSTGNRGNITERYIYPYTIEKMKEYNSHLLEGLSEKAEHTDDDDDYKEMMSMLKDVSKEDLMKALLKVQSDRLKKLQKGGK